MYTFHKIINKLNSFFHIELWCSGANQLKTAKNSAVISQQLQTKLCPRLPESRQNGPKLPLSGGNETSMKLWNARVCPPPPDIYHFVKNKKQANKPLPQKNLWG